VVSFGILKTRESAQKREGEGEREKKKKKKKRKKIPHPIARPADLWGRGQLV